METATRSPLLLVCVLIACLPAPTAAALAEVEILTELYSAANGPGWLSDANWTANADPCTWQWVSCTRGKVRKLKLEFNNLNGTLPNSLGSLDAATLTYLSFHHNALRGTLPASIASLTSLKTLYAANNEFTGNLPRGYGSLRNLGRLFVSSNRLAGTVPVCYGSLKALYRAMFSDNADLRGSSLPSGELPTSFRSLERLVQLNGPLAQNQFWPRGMPRLAATAHNNRTPTYYSGARRGVAWRRRRGCVPSARLLRFFPRSCACVRVLPAVGWSVGRCRPRGLACLGHCKLTNAAVPSESYCCCCSARSPIHVPERHQRGGERPPSSVLWLGRAQRLVIHRGAKQTARPAAACFPPSVLFIILFFRLSACVGVRAC